jgi:hypothetical protein
MSGAIRRRVGRAAHYGLVATVIAVAVQWFIGIPVGNQPEWLGYLTLTTAVPASYITFPFGDPLEHLLGMELGSGRIVEVTTPFGPAMRAGPEDIALIALGTLLMVSLTAYLAVGMNEMIEDHNLPG